MRRMMAGPEALAERVSRALAAGVSWLLARQAPEGYWCGELEADATLEADYILYLRVLGRTERIPKLARYVAAAQLPDGGWNTWQGGPSELNATVKGYVALKLAGFAHDDPALVRARQRVQDLGGLERCNSFTRFYLAMVGAIDWRLVPAVPPELTLVPSWLGLSLYRMSSWTRAVVVPMTIIYALRSSRLTLPELAVTELFRDPASPAVPRGWTPRIVTWRNLFLVLDRLMKLYERSPWKPFRQRALRSARRWMVAHFERSDGLAAIYPAMMNSVFALVALGGPVEDPVTARAIGALARLEIEEGDTVRVQPCVSPVWDTAIAMVALQEAGVAPDDSALVKAAGWLLDNQVLGPGDWQHNNPGVEPGGWAFEFRNEFYPDVDDTAFVLIALRGVAYPDRERMEQATARGLAWMLAMQNRDGGWGAFDRANDLSLLTQIPFADHNAMIDPSTADVTARVLECLGLFGYTPDHPAVARGFRYLERDQTPEGAWFGRWGVNYIYGTSGVLRATDAVGMTPADAWARGAAWLRSVQNADGGFGETCASYDDPAKKGCGPSTASQTAWAVIGLLAANDGFDTALARGLSYLLDAQGPNGSWEEHATTGTGYPRVFYLTYHLYRHAFPLSALARYHALHQPGVLPAARAEAALT